MNKWDTDKIIGTGLILALWLHMMIVCVVEITCGKTLPLDPASNSVKRQGTFRRRRAGQQQALQRHSKA